MSVALDIGSTWFRSLRRQGSRFIARRIPAVYCVFDDHSANKRLLDQLHIPYSPAQSSLLVIGEAAEEASRCLNHPLVPVISQGQLPYHDPVGRQVCAALVEALVPISDGKSLCLTCLPVATTHDRNDAGLIDHVVRLRGYQFARLHSARAVILSELEAEAYTGIGISVGAESVTMAVTHLGQTQFSGTFGRGARSIEENFARLRHKYQWDRQGNKYLDISAVREWQRTSKMSLIHPNNGDENLLAEGYYRLLSDAFSAMFPEMLRLPVEASRRKLPVIISGGPTHLTGFSQLLKQAYQASHLPREILDVRVAKYDPYTVARGLMIEATLQAQVNDEAAVA